MTPEELDNALEELETRLERLRALYEQYFLGFEKIEPTVPRKDVDRRIYLLRREKIRNTGRRFKLQTLIQRYNTFQQYWQRVCREIENGTYRRHLLRAERQMNPDKNLTIATKRRFGKALALAQQAAAEASGASAEAERQLSSDDLEPESDPATLRPTARASRPSPAHSPAPRSPQPLSPVQPSPSQFASEAPTAPHLKIPPPARRPGAAPPEQRPSAPPGDRSFESLELDMGFLGSWVPGAPEPAPAQAPRKAAPPPKPGARPAAPPPKPAATPPEPARSSPRAAPASPEVPAPEAPLRAASPPKAKSSPKAAPPPKARSSPRAAPPPRPAPERPAAAANAARALGDDRVKELHQKLMELKRQNKEAGQVSLEGLAKTLRATEGKLREQHKNRKIDFDVVIRDGKAIVKPTVR